MMERTSFFFGGSIAFEPLRVSDFLYVTFARAPKGSKFRSIFCSLGAEFVGFMQFPVVKIIES